MGILSRAIKVKTRSRRLGLSCFTVLIAMLILTGSSHALTGKMLVRFNLEDRELTQSSLAGSLDIAGYKPCKWFDAVIVKDELDILVSEGFDEYYILYEDVYYAAEQLYEKGDLGEYHTYNEMLLEMQMLANNYPDLAKLVSLGTTHEGRDVWAMKVSDNVDVQEDEPEALYVGCHHAREIITPEIPLYIMNWLLENYGSDQRATFLVNERQLWFVPMMNPDGHNRVANGSTGWRKNCRNNGDGTWGVDNNRNWGYMWGYDNSGSSPYTGDETYRGPSAFSEPENQAVRDLCLAHDFKLALSYHSYGRLLLCPWGYINSDTPDHDIFMQFMSEMCKDNNYEYGNPRMGVIYNTNGDADDWWYGEQTAKPKTYGVTFEVGSTFIPPDSARIPLIMEVFEPSLYLAEIAGPFLDVKEKIFDEGSGDDDGQVDPGEEGLLTVRFKNNSLYNVMNPTARVSSESQYITVLDANISIANLPMGAEGNAQPIGIVCHPSAPEGTLATLRYSITAGLGVHLEVPVTLLITRSVYQCPRVYWNLNFNPGWTVSGDFAFGHPTGQGGGFMSGNPDPDGGHTGPNVYGNNLNGNYTPNTTSYVTTPALDFTDMVSVELIFWRWLNCQGSDEATVEVFSGGNWVQVWRSSGEITDDSWNEVSIDITEQAAGRGFVKLRWGLKTGGGIFQYTGWNIDDIGICGYALPAETPTPTPTPTVTNTPDYSATPTPTGSWTPEPTDTPTPTGSHTPAPTNTPTPTMNPSYTAEPTFTPTPTAGYFFSIDAAGYWDTSLTAQHGGRLTMVAVFLFRNADYIATYYYGRELGIRLNDDGENGDFAPQDSIFGYSTAIDAPGSSTRLLIEFRAILGTSKSPTWPYLICNE